MLLVLDNVAGHKTPEFVCRLFAHGVMPPYAQAGGSWLNMAASIQRTLVGRPAPAGCGASYRLRYSPLTGPGNYPFA